MCNFYIPWVQPFQRFVICNVFYLGQMVTLRKSGNTIEFGEKHWPSRLKPKHVVHVQLFALRSKPQFSIASQSQSIKRLVSKSEYQTQRKEVFRLCSLVEQDWLRNTREVYWVIPPPPSRGGRVWVGFFFFVKVEITEQRNYLSVDLALKISKSDGRVEGNNR